MTEESNYFFQCRNCDARDRGTALPKFRTLECPACGSENVERWPAPNNVSRDWAYCMANQHEWVALRNNKAKEQCTRCGQTREFQLPPHESR